MREVTYNALIRKTPIKDFLIDQIGEEGLVLIEILFKSDKYVSEFTLAEHSAIYVNTVRSLLYKLYEYKIVKYTRKREKNRGWYIYSWKLNPVKLVSVVIDNLLKDKEKLDQLLSKQSKDEYFYCKDCEIKLKFSEAMEYNFSCPNCFNQMIVKSPEKENKELNKQVTDLEKEIDKLERIKERLEWMEEQKRELERQRLAREEKERQELADKGMFFCTKCKRAHKIKSKIGKEHKEFEK